jgi:hypothetical protein
VVSVVGFDEQDPSGGVRDERRGGGVEDRLAGLPGGGVGEAHPCHGTPPARCNGKRVRELCALALAAVPCDVPQWPTLAEGMASRRRHERGVRVLAP